MKKLILLLCITLLSFNSFAQDQHLIDSLQTVLKTAKDDTTKINILLEMANKYVLIQIDSALHCAEQAYQISLASNDIKKKYLTSNWLSSQYFHKGVNDKGLEYALRSLKYAEETKDKVLMINANQFLSRPYSDLLGNLSKGLEYGKYALKLAKETGNANSIIDNLESVSTIYFNHKDYDNALIYSEEQYKTALQLNDTNQIIWALSSVGDCYRENKNYTNAIKNYNEAIDNAKKDSIKYNLETLYNNVAVLYEHINRKNAIMYYLLAINIAKKQKNEGQLSFYCRQISNTYLKLKDYGDALKYNQLSMQFEQARGAILELKILYKQNAEINDSLKDYKKASVSLNKYISISEQIQTSESQNKISEMEVALESEKKQKQIDLINKDKKVQAAIRNSFIIGFVLMLLFAGIFFNQRNHIKKGKQKSDELLLNILPSEVAEELKDTGTSKAKNFDQATVMFTDFKDFTNISEKMSPEELVKEIDTCFSAFDNIIHKYGVEKIKTIGDAYMCAGGLPVSNNSHAEDVVHAALEIRDFMTNHNKEKLAKGELPFEIRIGINTGPVVAGIVGVRKFAYDIWGDTVNLANRMESSGEAGKVNISGSTYEFVKDKFACTHRGKIMTKGKGEVDMYFVEERI